MTVMNPLGLQTPANNRFGRAVELGERIIRNAVRQYKRKRPEGTPTNRPKQFRPKRNMPPIRAKTMSMGSYGKGFYKGGFAPLKDNSVTYEEKALNIGCGKTLENYGKAQGTEIVWIGATTLNINELSAVVAKAILRKLYSKAGIHITNSEVILNSLVTFSGTQTPSGAGFKVLRKTVDNTGATALNWYTTVSTETLTSVASNCGLQQEIVDVATAAVASWTNCIELWQIDNTASTDEGRRVATLNLNNELIHYSSKVKLVVQNRTKGATGTADALDVIDAQPLKGRMYYFRKGNPIVREMPGTTAPPNTNSIMSRWTGDTIVLYSDTTTGYDGQLKNPPPPSFFQNCSKSSYITLEPGDLKDVSLQNETVQYYSDFLRSLNWITAGTGFRRQKAGDSILIALEERLNSGSSNPIIVNYEAETSILAYCTTGRVDPIVKSFGVASISM